jgi:peptidoglycan/LPS O-acetylase OafA/YrhL
VAALTVIASHGFILLSNSRPRNIGLGHVVLTDISGGVYLFFALSGYLIAGPFLAALHDGRPLPDRRGYAVRRVARIVPAYWLALGAVVFVFVLRRTPLKLIDVVTHLLLIHSWVPHESRSLYVVAWTLGIEAGFYVLVPLTAWFLGRRNSAISSGRLAAIIAASWILSGVWSDVAGVIVGNPYLTRNFRWEGPLYDNLPANLMFFCPGMLVAILEYDAGHATGTVLALYRKLTTRAWPLLAAAAALWVLTAPTNHVDQPVLWELRNQLCALASGLTLVGVIRAGSELRPVTRVLAPIGVISYGLYLWHWVMAILLQHVIPTTPDQVVAHWVLADAVILAVSLPPAALSWFLLEKPLIPRAHAWARRMDEQRQSVPASPAA